MLLLVSEFVEEEKVIENPVQEEAKDGNDAAVDNKASTNSSPPPKPPAAYESNACQAPQPVKEENTNRPPSPARNENSDRRPTTTRRPAIPARNNNQWRQPLRPSYYTTNNRLRPMGSTTSRPRPTYATPSYQDQDFEY